MVKTVGRAESVMIISRAIIFLLSGKFGPVIFLSQTKRTTINDVVKHFPKTLFVSLKPINRFHVGHLSDQ